MIDKPKLQRLLNGRFLPLFLVLAMTIAFSSFNSANQKGPGLVATWTGTEFNFKQTKGPDISAMIEGGKALHIGGQLSLTKDGSYTISDPEGKVNGRGTWEMKNSKSFSTTDEHGETTVYEILTLKDNMLVTQHKVSMDIPDGKVEGVITLTYKR